MQRHFFFFTSKQSYHNGLLRNVDFAHLHLKWSYTHCLNWSVGLEKVVCGFKQWMVRSNFIHCVLMGLWKTEIVFSKLSCSVMQGQGPRNELPTAEERETASHGRPALPEHPDPPEARMVNGARFRKQQIFCLDVCSCLKCFVNGVFPSNNAAYTFVLICIKYHDYAKFVRFTRDTFLLHALYFRMGDSMSKNREYSFDIFQCIATTLDCN